MIVNGEKKRRVAEPRRDYPDPDPTFEQKSDPDTDSTSYFCIFYHQNVGKIFAVIMIFFLNFGQSLLEEKIVIREILDLVRTGTGSGSDPPDPQPREQEKTSQL